MGLARATKEESEGGGIKMVIKQTRYRYDVVINERNSQGFTGVVLVKSPNCTTAVDDAG